MAQGLGHRDDSGKVKLIDLNLNERSYPDNDAQHDIDPGGVEVGDDDLLRPWAETALAKLMSFEVDGWVGAAKGQPPVARAASRKGYRERPLHTRLGRLQLRIPKLRQGTYFPVVSCQVV